MYFKRDIENIANYFRRRFGFESSEPLPVLDIDVTKEYEIDVEVDASGNGISHAIVDEYERFVSGRATTADEIRRDDDNDDESDDDVDDDVEDADDLKDNGHQYLDDVLVSVTESDSNSNADADDDAAAEEVDEKHRIRRERNHARKAALREKEAVRKARKAMSQSSNPNTTDVVTQQQKEQQIASEHQAEAAVAESSSSLTNADKADRRNSSTSDGSASDTESVASNTSELTRIARQQLFKSRQHQGVSDQKLIRQARNRVKNRQMGKLKHHIVDSMAMQ